MSIEDRRLILHSKLVQILGSNNVYFQPPSNVQMKYPAVVYSRENDEDYFANDKSYYSRMRYTVTFITPKPQDSYIDEMKGALSYVKYDRHFTHDNLNHNVFTVYF